jgi:hypothetical protein
MFNPRNPFNLRLILWVQRQCIMAVLDDEDRPLREVLLKRESFDRP